MKKNSRITTTWIKDIEGASVDTAVVMHWKNGFSGDLTLIQENCHITIYTHNKLLSCFVALFQEWIYLQPRDMSSQVLLANSIILGNKKI